MPVTYPALSYELFPPRNAQAEEALWTTVRRLEVTRPDFVSVTYGAGGGNRDKAVALLRRLLTETTLKPLAHLTCVGSSRAELEELVGHLIEGGVRGILALRGDAPDGDDPEESELPHADDLVRLIRDVEKARTAQLAAGRVSVGVAAYATRHPESSSEDQDIQVLLGKQEAGADFALTQVYFDAEDYPRLLERAQAAGVSIPIIPGVMPLTSPRRMRKLADLAGIEVDRALTERLEDASDAGERRRIGVEATVALGRTALEDGAPGLHLYTFNQHDAALDVLDALALPRPPEAGQPTSL